MPALCQEAPIPIPKPYPSHPIGSKPRSDPIGSPPRPPVQRLGLSVRVRHSVGRWKMEIEMEMEMKMERYFAQIKTFARVPTRSDL